MIREMYLKPQGSYQDLLCIFEDIIAEEDYHKFVESYSVSGIRKEIEQNINDFGGDFRRLFGEEYKWVNVQMPERCGLLLLPQMLLRKILHGHRRRE